MASHAEYKIENFENYYGNANQVIKIIEQCPICGAKMIFTHLSDYKNLIVEESARCPECGKGNQSGRLIHIIN